MTIRDGLNLVDKYKEIYKESYRDIKLEHNGNSLKNLSGESMTLGLFEDDLEPYKDIENIEYSSIVIGHMIILKDYELLDSSTININLPLYKLKI